jgi:hypothetical protein
MDFPDDVIAAFASVEAMIKRREWFSTDWSCCSGLWQTEKYGDTVVLRLTKKNWSSVHPADSLYAGGEIQYAAWIDPKLFRRNEVRFEMHVFGFVGGGRKKIRKGDFTNAFRERAGARIRGFEHHDMERGGAVPYAGKYRYAGKDDLEAFLVRDFDNFASLAPLVDGRLGELLGK